MSSIKHSIAFAFVVNSLLFFNSFLFFFLQSPPFRLSISPFKEPPFGSPDTVPQTLSHALPPKPKPNMKVSALLNPSMLVEAGDSLSREKGVLAGAPVSSSFVVR